MVDHGWSWCNSTNNFNSINVGETIMEKIKELYALAKKHKKISIAIVVVIILIIIINK
jgi:hypothetical protein